MIIIKKTAHSVLLAIALTTLSTPIFAGSESINETIGFVEKALAEVNKSDFSAAQLLIKSARLSAAKIEGNAAGLNEANANVIQGQIKATSGEVKESADLLTKALTHYKAL